MRSLFVFAMLAAASGFGAAATGPAFEMTPEATDGPKGTPAFSDHAAPAPTMPPMTRAAAAVAEHATEEQGTDAESEGESSPRREAARSIEVDWDGAFGSAVWVSGEYDVAGCFCWLVSAGEVTATIHGQMEPGVWSGGVELTWDATAHPTLATLTLQVGTYRECMECGDTVQSYRVPGTSPLRVHLPESSAGADHFWITVSQTDTARQHVATPMPFHVSGLITADVPAATPQ